MFQTVRLSIIKSFSLYTQQWYISYRFADSLRAGSGWNILILLAAVSKQVRHIILLCVQWKTPDDGQRNCPKLVEFHSKNKFWEISASSWFYCKKQPFLAGLLLTEIKPCSVLNHITFIFDLRTWDLRTKPAGCLVSTRAISIKFDTFEITWCFKFWRFRTWALKSIELMQKVTLWVTLLLPSSWKYW